MKKEIIRSKRKSISIEIKDEDTIIVRAPLRLPNEEIDKFISDKRDWVDKHLAKYSEEKKRTDNIRPFTDAEIEELKIQAKRVITSRVEYFAPIVGVDYNRITIRLQKSNWGSCSGKGNLNFNLALMRMPLEVLDYVVVHELCHRIEMNHSTHFWEEVARVMPDYRLYDRWLKNNGKYIMAEVGNL